MVQLRKEEMATCAEVTTPTLTRMQKERDYNANNPKELVV